MKYKLISIALIAVMTLSAVKQTIRQYQIHRIQQSIVLLLSVSGTEISATGFQAELANGNLALVTAAHVCEGRTELWAISESGEGQLLFVITPKLEPMLDICMLTPFPDMEPLHLAKDLGLKEKEGVWTSGHGGGGPLDYSQGHITHLEIGMGLVEIGADIQGIPGDSGSPVLNDKDEVLGVFSMVEMRNGRNIMSYFAPLVPPRVSDAAPQHP